MKYILYLLVVLLLSFTCEQTKISDEKIPDSIKSPSWLVSTSLSIPHPFVDTPALVIDSKDSIYLQSTWTDIRPPYGSSSITKLTPTGQLSWISDVVPAGSVLDSKLEASGMTILEQHDLIVAGTSVPTTNTNCSYPSLTGINLQSGERLWTTNHTECLANYTLSTVKFLVSDESQNVSFAVGENHFVPSSVSNESDAQFLFIWKLNHTSGQQMPETIWLKYFGNNLSTSNRNSPATIYDVVIDKIGQSIIISCDYPDPNVPLSRILKISYDGSLIWQTTFANVSSVNITRPYARIALIPDAITTQIFVACSSLVNVNQVVYQILDGPTGQVTSQLTVNSKDAGIQYPSSVEYSVIAGRSVVLIANTVPAFDINTASASVLSIDLAQFASVAASNKNGTANFNNVLNWQFVVPEQENTTAARLAKKVRASNTVDGGVYLAGYFTYGFTSTTPAVFYVAKLFSFSDINANVSTCLMGSYQNASNPAASTSKQCTLCPQGTYGGYSGALYNSSDPNRQATGCIPCIGGTHQSFLGRGQPLYGDFSCAALNHSNNNPNKEYNTTIDRCETASNYNPLLYSNYVCEQCEEGQYSGQGAAECMPCDTAKSPGMSYCPNDDDDDKGKKVALIIILVLGGVLLLGGVAGVGVVVYRRKMRVGYQTLE